MNVHLERIAPNMAPGALYVRIVTDTDEVLRDSPLTSVEMARRESEGDAEMAFAWVECHPGHECYVYAYDGDDGFCVKTIIIGDARP